MQAHEGSDSLCTMPEFLAETNRGEEKE